jgi:hypothetical protein
MLVNQFTEQKVGMHLTGLTYQGARVRVLAIPYGCNLGNLEKGVQRRGRLRNARLESKLLSSFMSDFSTLALKPFLILSFSGVYAHNVILSEAVYCRYRCQIRYNFHPNSIFSMTSPSKESNFRQYLY